MKRSIKHIYLLSDATGETVERVVRAALSQFRDVEARFHRVTRIRSREDVIWALEEVLREPGMVVYTLVDTELAQLLRDEAEAHGLDAIDLISPLLFKLSDFFGEAPQKEPGLLHQINSEYHKRVDAVDFTVKHDDGQDPRGLAKADFILVGVSRSSKTPLSMYLAHKGYKVANVPIVKGIDPPPELYKVDQKRVVGLIIDAERLVQIRTARLRNLGQMPKGSYADYERIEEELEFCRRLYRRNPQWLVIDVTKKSVEESAAEIIQKLAG
ncbi:kinase/pyrophosphorylase [Geobacter sulfurreducens]|jgi:regulator of PEP synthase PpsR (kinase-PPPase family)|uniref:Putative pyruvate, phosphate dikinase regulatory protein n=1 Tax=Geobacter sulfurreducens (strain ATCC 51573 / DSM 12127 / PCA) TaxID=243231 RepID=PDRP_GEOSL|nr:pyruvate, water dikinase regulatory protein [Geobacter sulfurreducens]Q74G02.1 RecName: Full=Putative pyruvate, phosphate dikinase regulatory protein; Short=PPDK regulatory protein [Geobacter sulfurreducens PCA]AAR33782.1 ADP--[pyruvate phosphate dikinase]-threonine phosphotransferase and [pyruvate phosphate dikinase]-phosphothreonine--phosphate pyrophosphorylase [Geobacter sulfurreducens PCA]ADI83286.1 ADP--[pyruvate phosphate dikinase]-threonine phosphotransferase and [pyruvate phosphate di